MRVEEVMSRSLKCITPDTTLAEAASIMRELDVGVLPVGHAGNPTGMLTDRDIVIRAIAENKDPANTLASEVITPRVCTVYADQDVEQASELMSREQVRRLLVLDRQRTPVGVISLGDLTRGSADGSAQVAMEGVNRPGQASERRATHP
jgi:CBS domain-containing protein